MASIAGCVLELDGAVCIAVCLPWAGTAFSSSLYFGRSVASGVLRELSNSIEGR